MGVRNQDHLKGRGITNRVGCVDKSIRVLKRGILDDGSGCGSDTSLTGGRIQGPPLNGPRSWSSTSGGVQGKSLEQHPRVEGDFGVKTFTKV